MDQEAWHMVSAAMQPEQLVECLVDKTMYGLRDDEPALAWSRVECRR